MTKNNNKAIVIGAGPAGISSAYELYRSDASNILVIEKNDKVGGLARTLQFGQFKTDIGPHRFFSQQKHLYNLIEDLLAEKWTRDDRLTRFYINGRFFSLSNRTEECDFATLYSLTEFLSVYYLVSAAFAFGLGVAVNYTLCTLWSFQQTQTQEKIARIFFICDN